MLYRFNNPSPTILQSDNMGALPLSSKSVFHGRTKHIEIQYHWIGKVVENIDLSFSIAQQDIRLRMA